MNNFTHERVLLISIQSLPMGGLWEVNMHSRIRLRVVPTRFRVDRAVSLWRVNWIEPRIVYVRERERERERERGREGGREGGIMENFRLVSLRSGNFSSKQCVQKHDG